MRWLTQFKLFIDGIRKKKDNDPPPLKRVGDMVNGDTGYTVQWALKYNPEGNLVIHPYFPLYKETSGTVELFVKKHGGVVYVSLPPDKIAIATESGWSGSFRIPEDQFIPCVELKD